MSSAASSETGKPTLGGLVANHWLKMSRLKLWAGTVGMQSLQRAAADSARNQEAESAAVRRTVWGSQEAAAQGGNEVNDTVLGDMTTVHHHHQQAPSQLGKILLGAGLMATGIGVPIGAAILASGVKETVVPPVSVPVEKPVETTPERPTVNIGEYELRLGK